MSNVSIHQVDDPVPLCDLIFWSRSVVAMSQPWSSMAFVDVLNQLFSLILRQVDDLDEFRTFLEAASVLEAKSNEPTWDNLFVEYVAPHRVEYGFVGSL